MSYNGSGTFLINTAGQPVVSGTVISSTAFNALTADLATGLSTAITKDGQTTITANIPMGTYKFTGLGAGTAATDSANLSQVQSTVTKLLASVSGADTITAVASPTLGAYAAGQMFYFVAAGDNTGAVTLNLDGLGAKAVTRDGSVALAAGDIKSGEVVVVVYDGTRFQVVSQLNSAGNATFANVSITSALNVGGVATFTGNPVLSAGTANGVLYLNGSKVATSGSALVFDGTNLGIGTSSPQGPLDVAASGVTVNQFLTGGAGNNAVTGIFRIGSGVGRGASIQGFRGGSSNVHSLDFYTYNSADVFGMRLDSSGNLGIGTNSPGSFFSSARNLVVGTGTGNNGMTIYSQSNAVGDIAFADATTDPAYYSGLIRYDHDANNMRFYTASSERARITSGGDLLVGKTTTYGDEIAAFYESANGSRYLYVENPNTGTSAAAIINANAGSGGDLRMAAYGTNHSTQANNASLFNHKLTGALLLGTEGTERARIDSSGNLGIGVTPSAWNASYKALQIGASCFANYGTELNLGQNFYVNSSGNYIYVSSSSASYYRQYLGTHAWFYAASGTAGNTISFTQAMTLDASGNLGIGTTSPGAKLDVQGNIILSASNATITFNSGGPTIICPTANTLAFTTSGTERARITSGGDFLVGRTSAISNERFSVEKSLADFLVRTNNTNASPLGQTIYYGAASPNGTANEFLYCYDSTALRASIRSNGGLANYQSNNVDLSDARTKNSITPAASMWDKISALEIVTYKYNDQTHDDVNVGVIAQQVESVEPVWVDADGFGETPEDGVPLKTVYTKDITFAAIKALQEAMARIEQLEAKVAALESK